MAGANRNQNDDSFGLLAIGMGLVAFFIFWYFFRNHIMAGLIEIKLFWVKGLKLIFGDSFSEINKAYDLMTIYTPKEIDFTSLLNSTMNYAYFYTPILGLLLFLYGYHVIKNNKKDELTRIHTRDSLCKSETRLWPWILPVLKIDLIKAPMKSGIWAMGKNPPDFCKKYNLLLDIKDKDPNQAAEEGELLNKEKAKRLFISQLGPLWDNIESLPIYAQALLLCFVVQADNDQKKCISYLEKLAISMANKKPDYSFVPELKEKYLKTPLYRELVSKNAYSYNVINSVLKKAREKGILPTSYFIWLKPLDRVLWFSLNCVGRKTPYCEVAGIFAQGLTEEVCGRKIMFPNVEQAVSGLEEELKKIDLRN